MTLEEKVRLITAVLEGKKGEDVVTLDLRGMSSIVDAFILASAQATVQAQSMADDVERAMKEEGEHCWFTEGYTQGRWILMDYGDVVVHIFSKETRCLYDLDRLWGDAPRLSKGTQGGPNV
jgi:ribosome-associated protein